MKMNSHSFIIAAALVIMLSAGWKDIVKLWYNPEEITETPLTQMQVVVYDFYGACDIIYLEVSNTSYTVTSEGIGLICSVGSMDLALREVSRALLDCPDYPSVLSEFYLIDDRDYPDDCLEVWTDSVQLGRYCPIDKYKYVYEE